MKCRIILDGGYDPDTFVIGEICDCRSPDARGMVVRSNTTDECLYMFNYEVEVIEQ